MTRTLAIVLVAIIVLVVLLFTPLIPAAGQTIPPLPATSTPGGPTPTYDPDGCHQPYCAPPVQPTRAPVATSTPAVDPGTGDDGGATGPGIINTPSPSRPQGLPNAAHLHFLPFTRGLR